MCKIKATMPYSLVPSLFILTDLNVPAWNIVVIRELLIKVAVLPRYLVLCCTIHYLLGTTLRGAEAEVFFATNASIRCLSATNCAIRWAQCAIGLKPLN